MAFLATLETPPLHREVLQLSHGHLDGWNSRRIRWGVVIPLFVGLLLLLLLGLLLGLVLLVRIVPNGCTEGIVRILDGFRKRIGVFVGILLVVLLHAFAVLELIAVEEVKLRSKLRVRTLVTLRMSRRISLDPCFVLGCQGLEIEDITGLRLKHAISRFETLGVIQ